jgi:hypothetical protein
MNEPRLTETTKSHTPDPWICEPVPHTDDPEFKRDPAELFWITDVRGANEVLAAVFETSHQEAAANARLMMLAPTFLKALRHALPYLRAVAPMLMFQTAGQEFYPNREEAEAIITEVEGVLRKAGGGE